MRGALWLILVSACWTGSSERATPMPNVNHAAGAITCEQYWAHLDDVFETPPDVRASLPVTPEHCVEFESFTEEQRRCFLSGTTRETLSTCMIPDPQQRAEARKMLPMVMRAWPGTATPDAVQGVTQAMRKGCALLGIVPRPEWRTKEGVLVGFLLRDNPAAGPPDNVTATIAPSTWTCIATEPAGKCDELQRRCGPNASPE